MNRQAAISVFEQALRDFIARFMRSPFHFFYESDAQSHLCVSLDTAFQHHKVTYSWKGLGGLIDSEGCAFSSTSIRTEYPRYSKPGRFDIAYLEKQADEEHFYDLPVTIAVELKLGSDRIGADRCGGFISDIAKLREHRDAMRGRNKSTLGIALYLYQTKLQKGTDQVMQWLAHPRVPHLKECRLSEMNLNDDSIAAIFAWPNKEEIVLCGQE